MAAMQARLGYNQVLQLKQLLGALLTLLSLWALFSLDIQSEILLLAAVFAVGALVLKPALPERIPSRAWRFVTPALIALIAVDFLTTAPEFIPSLVRMIVWLLLYRNLAPRRQREDMQLILLCLFCVVLSGVMTVSLLFALQILLFTPLAMCLLFLICLSERGSGVSEAVDWSQFRWIRLLRDIRRVVDYRVMLLCSILFGFVVCVSTVLFILTPRFNLDQAIPFLEVQTQAMTGFSEEVKLGDVSEVAEDSSVAVRIDVPSLEALDAQPYWRMLVLDQYREGTFRMSASLRRQLRTVATRELVAAEGPRPKAAPDVWTFYIEGGVSRFLPVPGRYGIMRFQAKQDIQFFDEAKIHGLEAVKQSVFSYQLEGLQFSSQIEAGERENSVLLNPVEGQGDRIAYPESTLRIDVSDEDRALLRSLNEQIVRGRNLSASEYVGALEGYLQERFRYSLSSDGQVGRKSPSEDPVVNWLVEGAQGHCELFAGSAVLLARQAGIPARMIVGFAGGSWNSVEDYFLLRNSDAHAWVEYYDSDAGVWHRSDPTPSANVFNISMTGQGAFAIETGWDAWLDSLRVQWYRRVVNFEQEDQAAMLSSLQSFTTGLTESIRERMDRLKEVVSEKLEDMSAYAMVGFALLSLLLGFAAVYLLWRYRDALVDWLLIRYGRRSGISQVRRKAGRLIQRLEAVEGTEERLALIRQLQEIRFGPEASTETATSVFISARRLLRGKPLARAT